MTNSQWSMTNNERVTVRASDSEPGTRTTIGH